VIAHRIYDNFIRHIKFEMVIFISKTVEEILAEHDKEIKEKFSQDLHKLLKEYKVKDLKEIYKIMGVKTWQE